MPIKAIRTTIKLGDIDLDVFQLPDGQYRFSATQIVELLNLGKGSRVQQILGSKALQTYTEQVFGVQKKLVLPKISSDNAGNITALPIEAFGLVVNYVAISGNANYNIELAQAIQQACVVEALERRADTAFGVQRTEQERNEKLEQRMQSKCIRRKYTDVFKERLIEQIGEERYKEIAPSFFKNTTIQVNQHLFGQPHFNCDRDNMTETQLHDIQDFEGLIARRAARFPEYTCEELLAWALDIF